MQFQSFDPTQTQLRMAETASANVCAVFRLEGALDRERLARAVRAAVARVAPLAYRYHRINQVMQIVVSEEPVADLRLVDASADEAGVYALISAFCETPFRLDGGAPYVFCLLLGPHVHHLVFACHPAIVDLFALRPLFAAIARHYNGHDLPDELGFAQDVLLAEERKHTSGAGFHESLRFWLQLVTDTSFEWHPPRLESDLNDHHAVLTLDAPSTAGLRTVAQDVGVPIDDLLLFCFHLFVGRMTRNDTVLTTFRRRISSGPLHQIGFNENKPAFKSALDLSMPLRRFFRQAARLLNQTRYHADLPAREIARELLRREPEYKRITNVLFTPDPLPYGDLALDGVTATLLPSFSLRLETEDVAVYCDAREAVTFHLLTRSSQELSGLKMVFAHFLAMLARLRQHLDVPLRAVPLFDAPLRERVRALSDGGPLRAAPRDVMDCLAEVASHHPNAVAIRTEERSLSYAVLSHAARRVAANLGAWLNPDDEFRVGICLPRGERCVVAMLGVLAAGGAYVPLDPHSPADRLGFVMRDARLSSIIVESATHAVVAPLADCPIVQVEHLLDGEPRPDFAPVPGERAAYVIYTSGTTGRPKGVVLERRNLAHMLAAVEGVWDRGPGTRWLQFASFTFDASVLGIFNPLSHGAELIIAPPETRTDPEALFALMLDMQVTHADLPPALLSLLPRRPLPHLKVIFCGGEALDEETARFWSRAVELSNCYGPTEATVLATLNTLGGYKAATHLGRPLPGYQTWLLEESGELAMLGGVGEICIGGGAVARGYLDRPELSARKFVDTDRGRLYRTGDLARFLPNGDLEFLGRSDFQVKIRGFRIELGEIESAIARQPEVASVHVGVVDRDGSPTLVAWYVADALTADDLRGRLADLLPHYMVPAFLLAVDAFPLTANGKIDRARLPQPKPGHGEDAEPFDEQQLRVRSVWASVLRVSPRSIGPMSNFFHLGGHSLLAAAVCNRLSVRPRDLFECPVFVDFCERARSAPPPPPGPPLLATRTREAPVQNRLIRLMYGRAITRPDDNAYNIVSRIVFSPQVNAVRLRDALRDLIAAHPLFGASFEERNGTLWVRADDVRPDVALEAATTAEIAARLDDMRMRPLGLAQPPLWRAAVLCEADGPTSLLFCVHHAIFDGWSLNLFTEELARRYDGEAPTAPRTWFDYCQWARALPASRPYLDSLAYWRKKLGGAEARVELPRQGAPRLSDANASITVRMAPAVARDLKRMADELGVTMPPLLFTLYLTWLWRLSNQEQLVVGYPYAGRDVPGTEEIYGDFVAMGFLRQTIDPQQALGDLARDVHRQMIDDKEHLVAGPYDAEIANVDRLNVIFSLQSGISLEGDLGGGTFKAEELPSLTAKADLAGIFYQAADGAIEGRIEYDTSVLDEASMGRFVDVFNTLVQAAARRPAERVGDLRYQSEDARNRLLDLASGPRPRDGETTLPQRFAEVVAAHGSRVAVVADDRQLTYEELDDLSDRIAAHLLANGTRGGFVGLCMEKGAMAVAAIFGILKAGAAYVPLDPTYPAERLRFFVQNCGVRTVLCDAPSRLALGIEGLHYVDATEAAVGLSGAVNAVSPDDLAYVIHTSGSTGMPKGVLIEHRTVVRMIEASAPAMSFEAGCVSTLNASLSFDTSVLELFLPLLNGGTLAVVPESARRDPLALHRVLREAAATHVILSPVMLANLPRETWPALRLLGFGGDAIDEATAAWWSRQTRLFSLYGPTEITVQATVGEIAPGANCRTIGRPLAGYRVYLLNRQKQPVPQGVIGEICIGGSGLARGYQGRDDLTHERFVLDPFAASPYALMYLTGDLGRHLPDGSIEFMGRNDGQIKLRGFRIEMGEIESRLSTFARIRQVACAVHGEGDARYLAAYYVADDDLEEDALRHFLQAFLPDYMIPSFWVRMPALPASPNGKIDRKALPAVSRAASDNPPHDGLERRIADVWEDVLQLRGIGRDESFFNLGGNSLLAVRMQAELRRRCGVDLSMAAFYRAPTIEALAAGRGGSALGLALEDAARGLGDVGENSAALSEAPPRTVLLTGAAGFLGIFLLAELCGRVDRVTCLLRTADVDVLRRQAETAGVALDFDRISVLAGDLAAPRLGLDLARWSELASSVDLILHCGAFVHHLHGYETMRAVNVEGTRELLRLAVHTRRKRFCYVSTMSVPFAVAGGGAAREAVVADAPALENGYIMTKWVGEQLVAQAAKRHGLAAVVARPGNITGTRASGFTNFANNHFWLFNKGCLQLGAFPDVEAPVEMMPVDVLAAAMTALALGARPGLLVANLFNRATMSLREFVAEVRAAGFTASVMAPAEWQQRLASIGEENALSTIREFYVGDLPGRLPAVDQSATLAALRDCGASMVVDTGALVGRYLSYLQAAGFLEAVPLRA